MTKAPLNLPGLLQQVPKGRHRTTTVDNLQSSKCRVAAGYARKLTEASQIFREVSIDIGKQEHLVVEGDKDPQDVEHLIDMFSYDKKRLETIMKRCKTKLQEMDPTNDALQYYNNNEGYVQQVMHKYKEAYISRTVEKSPEEEPVNTYQDDIPEEDVVEPAVSAALPKDLESRILLKLLKKEVGEERLQELEEIAAIAAEAARE